MAKNIVIFADGTGNSAAKLFKTNVWRMYQAVEISKPVSEEKIIQIAYYHDGVGTSAYKPLALLGGVFGIGLMQNVIDIYKFICRNYEPGDNIYLFGFSRGAFTIRILASMIVNEGVLRCATEEELNRYAPDIYRNYRRSFKLPLSIGKGKQDYKYDDSSKNIGLVDLIRNIRDFFIKAVRKVSGEYRDFSSQETRISVDRIAFIGVWDTVSAYGLPFEELTRAIDDWVWPLSMPNYRLSEKVACARHALALDEERDSFQPLLWDEVWEKELKDNGKVATDRLQQVWFAGVHSNVGGGYPNDSLSHVSLRWMMDEAGAHGLLYKPETEYGWTLQADPFGKRYNSRSGVAGYYRPQARRLIAKLQYPPDHTLILQDPRYTPPLLDVKVHESVIARIQHGTDRYAPISLPASFKVVGQAPTLQQAESNDLPTSAIEFVFDDVWRRRVVYFASVVVTLILLLFPVIERYFPPGSCEGPQCIIGSMIRASGGILPNFLEFWINSFASMPGSFMFVIVVILAVHAYGARLKVRIEDGMREIWALSFGLPIGSGRPATQAGREAKARLIPDPDFPPVTPGLVRKVRTATSYQRTLQQIKWRWIPDMFGVAFLFLLWAGVMYGVARCRIVLHETFGGDYAFIESTEGSTKEHTNDVFMTKDATWPFNKEVERGKRYRIHLTVTQQWYDDISHASPLGIFAGDMSFKYHLVLPWRRVLSEPWFKPIFRIEQSRGQVHLQPLEFTGNCSSSIACGEIGRDFIAEFTAERSGRVSMFVNDTVISFAPLPWIWRLSGSNYKNNKGSANITLSQF